MKKLFAFLLAWPLLASLSACGGGTLEDGVFTIGLEAAYAPFNWTTVDQDLGVPIANSGFLGLGRTYVAGYDVDIAQYIAEDNDFDLQVRKIAWDGLIPALQSGSIDAIVAGMTDTPARRESVSFSAPYYESHLVMVVRLDGSYTAATSIDDFAGAYLAAQVGTVQNDLIIDYATDEGEDDLYVEGLIAGTPYETYPDALLALLEANSGLDGVLAEEPIGAAMVAQYPDELVLVEFWADETTYDDHFVISVSIAVRHEDADLLVAIDATLLTLDTATRIQWMQEAITASQADQ